MNFTRKTIFWVIALVFLGGLFHLLDERAETNKKIEQKQLSLFTLTADDITEFWSANLKTKTRIQVTRDGKEWKITEPIVTKGDAKAIGKLLKNLLEARKDAVLFEDPPPDKLQELGLDAPEQEMGFVPRGQPAVVIQFGNLGPTHNVAYARFQGERRVLRVHADLKQEAIQTVYALRDKSILEFDPLQMVRLELTRQGMTKVIIRHEQDRWDMLEPVPMRANMAKVLETVYSIKNSEIKAFPEPNADELTHVMNEIQVTVSILLKDAKAPHVLHIGSKDRNRRGYYAKRGDSSIIFVIEEDLVAALMANDTLWRETQ